MRVPHGIRRETWRNIGVSSIYPGEKSLTPISPRLAASGGLSLGKMSTQPLGKLCSPEAACRQVEHNPFLFVRGGDDLGGTLGSDRVSC